MKRKNNIHTIEHVINYFGHEINYATTKLNPSVISSDVTKFKPDHELNINEHNITVRRSALFGGDIDEIAMYKITEIDFAEGGYTDTFIIVHNKKLYDDNGYHDKIVYDDFVGTDDELMANEYFLEICKQQFYGL